MEEYAFVTNGGTAGVVAFASTKRQDHELISEDTRLARLDFPRPRLRAARSFGFNKGRLRVTLVLA